MRVLMLMRVRLMRLMRGGWYATQRRYLNVWVPGGAPPAEGDGYAAMIFFYGGSWTTGSAMFPLYLGEALTVANNATVVVTVNYRLAALGFMASEYLRASHDNSTGNFGLQDQRLAMQWVQANAK